MRLPPWIMCAGKEIEALLCQFLYARASLSRPGWFIHAGNKLASVGSLTVTPQNPSLKKEREKKNQGKELSKFLLTKEQDMEGEELTQLWPHCRKPFKTQVSLSAQPQTLH